MKTKIFQSKYVERLKGIKKEAHIFKSEQEIQKEIGTEIKKVFYCTLVLAVMVVLYLCSYQTKEGILWDGNIEKGDYETSYEFCYEAEQGKSSGTVELTVPQKNYSEEEAYAIFQEVEERLEQEILGDNESLDKVDTDLCFVDSLEDYPVDITWSTDKEEIINSYGEVFNFKEEMEETVMVTAVLSVGEYEQEYSFPVCVMLPDRKDNTWWAKAVDYTLQQVLQKTEFKNQFSLPEQIGGSKVNFSDKENKRPWGLVATIPVVFLFLLYGNLKEAEKEKQKKEHCLIREYPEIVSRLSLYVQAGMTSKNAIGKMVMDYEQGKEDKRKKEICYGYEELRKTYYEMKSGISEHQAYKNLGNRIGVCEYKKLSGILVQQLEKGSKDFVITLQQETTEAFEKRKRIARESGEEAGTKMLLPMGILFAVTLVIIMAPACFSFII